VVNQDGNFTVNFRGLEPSIREIDNSSSRFKEITGISSADYNQAQPQAESQNEVEESRRQTREAERSRRETESETRIQQKEDKPLFLVRRK